MQWRVAVGPRASRCATVQQSIGTFRRRWSPLNSQPDVWKRLYHFRSKRLGHVTVAPKPAQEAQLNELWRTARMALSAARQARLVFCREDCDNLRMSARAETVGRDLIVAIEPRPLKIQKHDTKPLLVSKNSLVLSMLKVAIRGSHPTVPVLAMT